MYKFEKKQMNSFILNSTPSNKCWAMGWGGVGRLIIGVGLVENYTLPYCPGSFNLVKSSMSCLIFIFVSNGADRAEVPSGV